jgi:nitrogen fixation protein NifU and related proteins
MDLRELYQEVILDHNRRPRNKGRLELSNRHSEGHNPLCGDTVVLTLNTADGRVQEIRFDGEGCAISTASASMMTEAVKGKTIDEAHELFKSFQKMVTTQEDIPEANLLGEEIQALAGVREHPVRIKCATLAWHALEAALTGDAKVSTE